MRRLISVWILAASAAAFAALFAATGSAQHARSGSRGLIWVGDFETCDFTQWVERGLANGFQIVRTRNGQGRCAAALTVGPDALGIWSSQGDSVGLGVPIAERGPYGSADHTIWQHFLVRFPDGFRSTYGEWNWFTEWHNDEGYKQFGYDEYPNLCWTIRKRNRSERIAMRVIGGPSRAPREHWVRGPRLKRDHWYDFLVKITWSPDPRKGTVRWWLDGKRMYSKHLPTLYTRPDGSTSSVYLIQDYYRVHADWKATVLFDGMRIGRTRASVRYR